MAKCEHNCKKCKLPDCENDDITYVEIMEIENRDMSYGRVFHGKSRGSKNKFRKK